MKILAVDTSAKIAAAALTEGRDLVAVSSVKTDTHSTTLLPMIEAMLRAAGTKAEEIDLYAATVGPGSFTGVRIGVATVKGLAFAGNTPCVGISTLEAAAYNFAGIDGLIVPVLDARRQMVYAAVFRSCADGTVTRLTEDAQIAAEELLTKLADYGDERIYFTGDAAESLLRDPKCPKSAAETPEILRKPSACGAALRAYEIWASAGEAARENYTDAAMAPVYLKKTQAERDREERLARAANEQGGDRT